MYYIQTADRLTRTSVWLENMEGGIDHLRDVIIHDKLGICDELERQMQHLVDTYKCEWTEVVNDPERRKLFRQFVNTDETEVGIEIVTERGQNRPADWPKDGAARADRAARNDAATAREAERQAEAARRRRAAVGATSARVADFPLDGGAAIKYGDVQIAVFQLHQPRRVVRLPEHVPAQTGVRALARHHRHAGRNAQGRLPAAQEDLFAGIGRVPFGRRLFR